VLEELAMGEDEPWRVLAQHVEAALFPHHPYGRPIIGFPTRCARCRRTTCAATTALLPPAERDAGRRRRRGARRARCGRAPNFAAGARRRWPHRRRARTSSPSRRARASHDALDGSGAASGRRLADVARGSPDDDALDLAVPCSPRTHVAPVAAARARRRARDERLGSNDSRVEAACCGSSPSAAQDADPAGSSARSTRSSRGSPREGDARRALSRAVASCSRARRSTARP
jgi:hypothetical protein